MGFTMGKFHRHEDGTVHSHDHAHTHGDHSGYATGTQRIEVLESIFAENDVRADINRDIFARNGIRVLNLMSSPGSGKTAVLSATLDELAGDVAVGVIEGDIATDLDAARLEGRGAQISLLNTADGFGGECHLDAPMVNRAMQALDLPALDLVIVENVGNLVCPAVFDVGEHAKAVVVLGDRGRGQAAEIPGDVPGGGRRAAQQDRPGAAPRCRRRHLHRARPRGEPGRRRAAAVGAHRRGHAGVVRLATDLLDRDDGSRSRALTVTRVLTRSHSHSARSRPIIGPAEVGRWSTPPT